MSYFKKFPFVTEYTLQGKTYAAMDITRRTGIDESMKDNQNAYVEYEILPGETPEMLADRAYDNANLYWVILLFNNIFDIDSDWPLSHEAFERFVDNKYNDRNAIHHYESASTGAYVESDHPTYDLIPVTNYEYEIGENEKKRKIKIPNGKHVSSIVNLHNRLISQ